ncbi:13734_t:CDS:2, partial [Gigaspora margarita]
VKVVNIWKLVQNYLKKCNNFFNEFGLVEAEKKLQELQTEKSCTDFDYAFQIYSNNDDYDSVSIYSEKTNRSTGSITSQNTNISNSNKMVHYLARTLTYKEQAQFEKHILNMTIENSCQILKEAADGMQNIIKTKAQEDSNSIMLVFDEWKKVAKQEILGSILVTSRGKLLI